MNLVNYDKEMEKAIKELKNRPKLLLHSCCAPCSSACIERLNGFFDLTVYYYNPNIDSEAEYELRSREQVCFCAEKGIKTVVEDYRPEDFFSAVVGREKDKEGGARCKICYELRLRKTFEYALKHGYDYFATTLTVSPLKNAALLNETGFSVASDGVKYLPSDFKKKNGYLRSIELSKEYGLYRQHYCGCVFSKNARILAE